MTVQVRRLRKKIPFQEQNLSDNGGEPEGGDPERDRARHLPGGVQQARGLQLLYLGPVCSHYSAFNLAVWRIRIRKDPN